MSADARVIRLRKGTFEGRNQAGRTDDQHTLFEARQLEVDKDEQLEVVGQEEEDWDPQDELMNVERQASSGHMITFSCGILVSEERVRLQLDFGCVLITMEKDTPRFQAWAGR
ncbi:unnamed protein product [Heligmosomoides polygyrus]|uniref:Uncharacterized protein n=1 Tax=Heligmosomoides polygyrus TaxID=6339 RepID=A0A183FNT4_HELPZ|nr:unnamed protein product [Heligmosomoides polygyrus]